MAVYVNAFARVADPSGVVTTTSTVPTVPAGAIADRLFGDTKLNDVAGVPPKVTDVEPTKLVPNMVTFEPPALEPLDGVTLVMDGALTGGAW